ncbi:unnamed protein product [Closterium sp. Yama58-4]|nr:unnamed protein product [Closterium sp. Yama58-4]
MCRPHVLLTPSAVLIALVQATSSSQIRLALPPFPYRQFSLSIPLPHSRPPCLPAPAASSPSPSRRIISLPISSHHQVFDGHEGSVEAAEFAAGAIVRHLLADAAFTSHLPCALHRAFLATDHQLASAWSAGHAAKSGTTALTAVLADRSLVVANAGDCRAVLCRRGRSILLSRDHRASHCHSERQRVEAAGGHVVDGYLNGYLMVTRALGNWHLKDLKSSHITSDSPSPPPAASAPTAHDPSPPTLSPPTPTALATAAEPHSHSRTQDDASPANELQNGEAFPQHTPHPRHHASPQHHSHAGAVRSRFHGHKQHWSHLYRSLGWPFHSHTHAQHHTHASCARWEHKQQRHVCSGVSKGPLIASPDVWEITLTDEDEFLLLASDGLWDVFRSENAVDYARRQLRTHNDPQKCAEELVAEALRRGAWDNLTVVAVCLTASPPPPLVEEEGQGGHVKRALGRRSNSRLPWAVKARAAAGAAGAGHGAGSVADESAVCAS